MLTWRVFAEPVTYNKQALVDFIPILLKVLLKRTSVVNYTLEINKNFKI